VPTVSVAAAEEFKEKDSLVACLEEVSPRQLKISDMVIEVCSINETDCNLLALLDIGSPVSFIRSAIVEAYFGPKAQFNNTVVENLKALNGSRISIIGSKNIHFRLCALPTVELNNKFQIFNNNLWSTHLILVISFMTII